VKAYPRQIECIPGFRGWHLSSDPPSRERGVTVIAVEPLGCRFSRALDEVERADVLDFLRRHVESNRTYLVKILLGTNLEGLPTAERLDALRAAVRETKLGALSACFDDVFVEFGQDQSAAQEAQARLVRAGFEAKLSVWVKAELVRNVLAWRHAWRCASDRVEDRMRPGAFSAGGFLGETEQLDDVIERDASTLAALGVSPTDLAGRLREILGEALARSRSVVDQETCDVGPFRVSWVQWRGIQQCPWGCQTETSWASIDFVLKNRHSGAKFKAPGLIVHLIAAHGFFEGRDSPYRVDPALVVEVLESRTLPVQSTGV
jgi:hypothetical protein